MNRALIPHSNCPLCGETTKSLLTLNFPERHGLPETIDLSLCPSCDFAFTCPGDSSGYKEYYASTANDHLGNDHEISPVEMERYQSQINALRFQLDRQNSLRVLDIGCGRAGLLRTLRKYFSQHQYYGSDPNITATTNNTDGISVTDSWQDISLKFDLIILSHTVEHIIDLDEFSSITRLLTPTGALYIELPDSSRYADFPRREYQYYIDRLHVNHFTQISLSKLLIKWGLFIINSGKQDFQYKDGNLYPAFYAIATFCADKTQEPPQSQPLRHSLSHYLQTESEKANSWQQKLALDNEIIVYGFGDNFFRSIMPGGPLSGYSIRAVVDVRNQALSQTDYAKSYNFIDLANAIQHYSSLPFIVTISWGAESVAQKLLDSGVKFVFVL